MEDDLAFRIEKWLKRRRMSARGLSIQAGLNETAIRDILNGKSAQPRLDTLRRIASALDLHVNDLIPDALMSKYSMQIASTTARELIRRGIFENRESGSGLVLYGDFPKRSFVGTNLTLSTFIGSDLRGADFSSANLTSTDFTDCDLRGANFTRALVDRTVFVNADVSGANFEGVDLSRAIWNMPAIE